MTMFPTLDDIDKLPPYEPMPQFHAVVTITLGELLHEGVFNLHDDDMRFVAYNEEQRNRLIDKIEARYYWREVSIIPIKHWKMEYVRVLNEIMPKYIPLYKRIDEGFNPLSQETVYGKSRDIYSDFPQTLLSGNSDYASTGRDREYEDVHEGDFTIRAMKYAEEYKDVDVMVLDEIERLFSPLVTVALAGY